jgi:RsiW-degrading membrane proteinase PrsW (M82 family)
MGSATLVALAIVAPIVAAYLLALRWAERFEPEPLWLVGLCFAWGGTVAAFASWAGIGLAEATLGPRLHLAPAEVFATSDVIVAPLLEEASKGAALVLLYVASRAWLRELDGPLDGLVYGAAIGLGFTLTEDALYVRAELLRTGFSGALSTTLLRTVILGLAHCTYTAATGLGVGIAAERAGLVARVGAPVGGFVVAVSMHALHNVLAGYGPPLLFDTVLFTWGVDLSLFVAIGALLVRERRIVLRELEPEVGELVTRSEVEAVASWVALDRRLVAGLFRDGLRAYLARSERQRAAVKLAMTKHRRRLGGADPRLAEDEEAARERLRALAEGGVRLAPPSERAEPG